MLQKLLGFEYLLLSSVLNLVKVFAQLDIGKLLQIVLILGEIGHAFGQIGAGVNKNTFPIHEAERRTEVVKHWQDLDFKGTSAATSRAVKHVSRLKFAFVRSPKRLELVLSSGQGVPDDLFVVLCCRHLKQLIFFAQLRLDLLARVTRSCFFVFFITFFCLDLL